jgi:hypothetical protein
VGYFSSISREFLKTLPFPDELKKGAPDFTFHWVNEDGKTPGKLTGNMETVPTVRYHKYPIQLIRIFKRKSTKAWLKGFLRQLPAPRHRDCWSDVIQLPSHRG